jgi:hypothetical protein
MAKVKDQSKTGSKVKSQVKTLSKVKNASVTKPSQTPIAKSKQVAKEVATKAINGNKKSKKVTPPSSDEESDDESAESASSEDDSEDDSEDEEVTKKPVVATNGKLNGNDHTKKKEVDTSDSSDSSASETEASVSNSSGDEKPTDEDSDDSDDSDAESEEAAPVAAVTKNTVKKTVQAGKAAVNGTAKAVAKATVSAADIIKYFTHSPLTFYIRKPLMKTPRTRLHLTMIKRKRIPRTRKTTLMIRMTLTSRHLMKRRRKSPQRNARLMLNQSHLLKRSSRNLPSRISAPRTCSLAT